MCKINLQFSAKNNPPTPWGLVCESLCFPFPTLPQLKPETRADPQAVVIHSPGSCHPPAGSCHPPRSWFSGGAQGGGGFKNVRLFFFSTSKDEMSGIV